MKDFKGQDVFVGDTVVFTIGGAMLRESEVTGIEEYETWGQVTVKRIKRKFHSSKIYKVNK